MAYTKEERQEYDHHYYLANREKRLLQNKVWREANKEHVSEYNRKRYLMKKEKKKMKDEKVISYTSTRVITDKKGRKLLVKISAEVLDTETMKTVSLQITDKSKFEEARQAMFDTNWALAKYILACDDN